MYFKSDLSGCLISLLFFLLALYLLKELWWLIVGIALIVVVFYWGKKIYLYLVNSKKIKDAEYNPQMGEVYKVCPFCNAKLKVTAITCPYCGKSLN